MAKEVSFYIKLDDRGTVKRVTADAEELGRAVRQVQDESERASRKIWDWAQAAQAFDVMQNAISELNSVMTDLTAAYQVQLVAETQLNTIMRQRMAATDAEIQSVKDLCSAQQELGVIGDEVQLSGAQQMATFLSEKQSLDVLIPAMNNLLAQQEGLKASTSGAVSIGNMMGKAMQGQVEVLQRVGITFDEAQKQVLQYGTESERAAMLAKVITENVGEMNAELAKTDAGKQQQLLNTLGDYKEQLGQIVQKYSQWITIAAQTTTVITGVSKLYASLRSVAVALNLVKFATTAWNAASVRMNALVSVLSATMRGAAVSTAALKLAIQGLLISSGVGLAIVALTEVIGALMTESTSAAQAMDTLSEAEQRAAEAHRQEASDIARVKTEMQTALDRLRAFNGGKEKERQLVGEMNQKYGQALGYYSTVAQWYKALTANSAAYCDQMVREIRLRSLADRAASIAQEQHDIEFGPDGRRRRYSTRRKSGYVKVGETDVGGVKRNEYEWRADQVGTSDLDHAKARIAALRKEAAATRAEMQKLFASSATSTYRHTEGWSATAPQTAASPAAGKTGKTGKTTTPAPAETKAALEGSIDYYEQQLRDLQARITATADESAARAMQQEYDTLAASLKELKVRIGLLPPEQAEAEETAKTATEQLREAYAKAQQRAGQIRTDYEAGIISREEAQRQADELNRSLSGLKLRPIEVELDTAQAVSAMDSIREGWNSIRSMGNGIGQITEAIEGQKGAWQTLTGLVDGFLQTFEAVSGAVALVRSLTVAQTAAGTAATAASGAQVAADAAETAAAAPAAAANKALTASLMEVAAARYFAAHAYIPFAGFGIGAGFAASAKATVAAIGATPFANGGLIYGPTLALMGEYGGARSNPEVVAPLDKLRGILADSVTAAPAAGGEWRVRGRDLVKVMANECRSTRRRTGLR